MQLSDSIVPTIRITKYFHSDSTGVINSLDFSADGTVMCTASDDESIKIYNSETGTESGKLFSKKYGVDQIRFTHSNRNVLHASKNDWNDAIRYLSLNECSYLRYFTGHRGQVVSLSLQPGEDMFMSASDDNTVKLWDLRQTANTASIHKRKRIASCYDPSGMVIAVGSSENTLSLHDRRYLEMPFSTFRFDNLPISDFLTIEIDRTGKMILILFRTSAILVDAFDGKIIDEFRHPNRQEDLTSICFSPDCNYITAGTSDGRILIWRRNGPLLLNIDGHNNKVTAIKWNPKKILIASGDTHVRFWKETSEIIS